MERPPPRDEVDYAETVAYLRELHGLSEADAAVLANSPDGNRYKALGNSMNADVMAWIGRRIQSVEDLIKGAAKC